ncbi:unnamed protein product [Coregonus sp. 'balchen']|nr:unnamed protein product [Coregonus sp. 'balchen']
MEREEQEKMRQQAIQQEEERLRELERERQKELEKERRKELERLKEMERRQLFELEKQKQAERERKQLLELEKQRLREKMEREEQEKMRQQAIQQEEDRLRELERERQRDLERQKQRELEREKLRKLERERQRDLERQKQRELERQRQKQLDFERQELENQRERKRESERERQRVEELERIKEMERRQVFDLEKQKQNERERQRLHELGKQRLREKMEREEQEKMRPVARQQEEDRPRIMERQRRENQERGALDSLPLRPKVLDLDSVSLGDQHSRGSPHSPGVRWKQPSPWADDHYRPGILDIDSFRSQTETQPLSTREVFPVAGIQGSDPSSVARSHPHSPEREGGHRMAPKGTVGKPSTVRAPSQQELWEQRLGINEESVDRPMAGPEPPRKPANKPSLEQLLHRLEDRATAPILVPERRWSGMPSEPSFPRREPHSSGSPMEQTWFPQDSEPQGHRVEARGQRRSQGSQFLLERESCSAGDWEQETDAFLYLPVPAGEEGGKESALEDDRSVGTMER